MAHKINYIRDSKEDMKQDIFVSNLYFIYSEKWFISSIGWKLGKEFREIWEERNNYQIGSYQSNFRSSDFWRCKQVLIKIKSQYIFNSKYVLGMSLLSAVDQ